MLGTLIVVYGVATAPIGGWLPEFVWGYTLVSFFVANAVKITAYRLIGHVVPSHAIHLARIAGGPWQRRNPISSLGVGSPQGTVDEPSVAGQDPQARGDFRGRRPALQFRVGSHRLLVARGELSLDRANLFARQSAAARTARTKSLKRYSRAFATSGDARFPAALDTVLASCPNAQVDEV